MSRLAAATSPALVRGGGSHASLELLHSGMSAITGTMEEIASTPPVGVLVVEVAPAFDAVR